MLEHVMAQVFGQPWGILPAKGAEVAAFIRRRAIEGVKLSAEDLRPYVEAAAAQQQQRSAGAVAVLPVRGVLMNRANMLDEMSGATSYQVLSRRFGELVDDGGVKAIVLAFESPGGACYGCEEFANQIYAARSAKPIVSAVDPACFSAAYLLASQAGELTITPSGRLGSIGTIILHIEESRALDMEGVTVNMIRSSEHKFEGNPFEPLPDEARAQLQKECDEYNASFVNAVARGRGVTTAKVNGSFGNGHTFGAKEAVQLGMADKVETLAETIARLGGVSASAVRSVQAQGAELEVRAEGPERDDADFRRRRARIAGLPH